jgi:hypothetical protein
MHGRKEKEAKRKQKEDEARQRAQNNVPRNLSRWLNEASGIDDHMLDASSYYSAPYVLSK